MNSLAVSMLKWVMAARRKAGKPTSPPQPIAIRDRDCERHTRVDGATAILTLFPVAAWLLLFATFFAVGYGCR